MSDELEKARSLMFDTGVSDKARRSEEITIRVQGEEIPVEMRATTLAESSNLNPPSGLVDQLGEETATNLALVAECAYHAETGDKLFAGDEHLEALANAPTQRGGWVSRLIDCANYVHGFSKIPPDGVQSPALQELESCFAQLEDIASAHIQSGEKLDPSDVKDIAQRGRNYCSFVDRGETDEAPEDEGKS